jgi:hypothetical protein
MINLEKNYAGRAKNSNAAGTPTERNAVRTMETIIDEIEKMYFYLKPSYPSNKIWIHINEYYKHWYIRAFREKYGLHDGFNILDHVKWEPNRSIYDYKIWISVDYWLSSLKQKVNEI